jgi:hypothetical protein
MGSYLKLFETLLEGATEYLKTTFELLKLKAVDKISELVATAIPMTFIIGVSLFALFFLHVGLAIWLGGLMGNLFVGFLVVGAFYLLLVLVFHLLLYKRVKRSLRHKVIKKLLS